VKYLLDTNVISEFRKGPRCHPQVSAWFASVPGDDLYLSVLALGELHKGLESISARDPSQAGALARWIEGLHTTFASRLIDVDMAIAQEWGRMNAVRPLPAVDSLMAASAKIRRMTFVTRDAAAVSDLGAVILDPFDPGALRDAGPPDRAV
jgi:predicted nucleic acid-binding protein